MPEHLSYGICSLVSILIAKKTEDTKGVIKIPEAVNRRTDNTMAKRESDFSAYYIQHNYL
jgi:hypothetical protein